MGKKRTTEPVPPEDREEHEDLRDFELSLLDEEGCGSVSHVRRVTSRGLEEREARDVPDEAPPGWPGG